VLVAAGCLGGSEGVIGDRLLAAHGVEDGIDGRIAEAHAEAERGSDGDKQREYDQQRVHVQPAFPLMQLPFVMSYTKTFALPTGQRPWKSFLLFRIPDGPRHCSPAERTEIDGVQIGPVLGRTHGVVGVQFVEDAAVHGAQRLVEDGVTVDGLLQHLAAVLDHKNVDGRSSSPDGHGDLATI
jgi:hypothetical protein